MPGKNSIKNTTGQVAVEFILMFVIVSVIVIYIWNLSIGLAALQVREYASFMVGRAITAAYDSNDKKSSAASAVMSLYNGGESITSSAGAATYYSQVK